MIIANAINRVVELRDQASFKTERIEGQIYAVELGKIRPLVIDGVEDICINTLTGVADYLSTGEVNNILGVHVVNHSQVLILGKLQPNNHNERWTYLKASAIASNFRFGHYYSINDFIINIQTCFVQTDVTAKILQIVGNIKDATVKTLADDGVTQSVNIKSGIERVQEATLPNPVILQPYRTFLEVDQPESPFVLRMNSGHGSDLPTCGLFEADNGLWKLEAMGNICAFLKGILPEDVKIIR